MKRAKEMGLAAIDGVIAFKLVWLRVSFYFLLPAGMLFLTQTETWGHETWVQSKGFLRNRLYAACFLAGASGLCAYIDSSFQRARERSSGMKDDRTYAAAQEAEQKILSETFNKG
jgi:hypothetical protein